MRRSQSGSSGLILMMGFFQQEKLVPGGTSFAPVTSMSPLR